MKRRAQHTIPFRDSEATVSGVFYPATRATRLDPSDPADFTIDSMTVDGKPIDVNSPAALTNDEADAICERMVEICEEAGDEREDRRDNELDR